MNAGKQTNYRYFFMCNRVKEAEEERKREIQEVIEIKDERSQMVNTEKDEIRRLVSFSKLTFFKMHYTQPLVKR